MPDSPMPRPTTFHVRPVEARDDAALAAIIRTVMPEFGATGAGFAINDPEVDWMHRAYSAPPSTTPSRSTTKYAQRGAE